MSENACVFLVDDNPHLPRATSRLLKKAGFAMFTELLQNCHTTFTVNVPLCAMIIPATEKCHKKYREASFHYGTVWYVASQGNRGTWLVNG
jgi:hypothetical protein